MTFIEIFRFEQLIMFNSFIIIGCGSKASDDFRLKQSVWVESETDYCLNMCKQSITAATPFALLFIL